MVVVRDRILGPCEDSVAEAAFWGFVGASSLVIAAELAFRIAFSRMVVGLVMAFGVGTLISSIAFELVEPALATAEDLWFIVLGLLLGSVVFFLGDRAVSHLGAPRRKGAQPGGGPASRGARAPVSQRMDDDGGDGENGGLGIVLGTALDGVPESVVLGMSIVSLGSVGPALLAAVWVSNLPESLGASVALVTAGRTRRWIRVLWWSIVAMSALAAALGFWLVSQTGPRVGAAVQAFAAGALLTMIADEMAPQAFGRSALYTGLATTAGFVVAFLLSNAE
jgi:ZIP family zinc transporter